MSVVTKLTGKDTLDDILSGFSKTLSRLDVFVERQDAKASGLASEIAAKDTERREAEAASQRARRTKTKLAELLA